MTNNTIPHDHHHRLRPHHHQETADQLQALAVKPPAKKQTRRRTHTSRPYQERLLNMVEARREIVTALKIHRASSTRQQQQQQQQSMYQHQHHHEPPPPLRQPPLQQQQVQVVAFQDRRQAGQAAAVDEEASLSAHTATSYYAAASFANNPLCSSPSAHWIAAAGSGYSSPPPILRLPCNLITPPELPLPSAAMGGLEELEHYYQGGGCLERLVRSLPAQPLGLNLSFKGFGAAAAVDDDGAKDDDCEDLFGSFPFTQPSPAASYSSYSPPPAVVETATTHAYGHGSPALSAAAGAENHSVSVIDAPTPPALIPAPDDGTQGVEWSEAAAADMAAWWSKIFESGQRAPPTTPNEEDVAATAAGLTAEEWRWLCGDDVGAAAEQGAVTGGVLATTMHVDDGDYSCCYEVGRSRSDDGEDVSLACMDGIPGDVQGWDDGDWFSSCS